MHRQRATRWASESVMRAFAAAVVAAASTLLVALDPLACAPAFVNTSGDANASGDDGAVVPIVVAMDDAGLDSSSDAAPDGGDSSACTPVGTGALGVIGCPCPTTGAPACAGNAQRQELICQGDVWVANGRCPDGQLCDSRSGATEGSCVTVSPACVGAVGGQPFCTSIIGLVTCDADLLSYSSQTCENQVCDDGGCVGVCGFQMLPADITAAGSGPPVATQRCSGLVLQQCSVDGTWFDQTTCPTACCGGTCIDPTSDTDNCGACGHSCQSGGCSASACEPAPVGHPSDGSTLQGPLAIDSQNLYATTSTGIVIEDLVSGSSAIPSLVSGRTGAYAIAVHGSGVYWTEPPNGLVLSDGVDGGAPLTIASGQNTPNLIAVDDANVYWTANAGTNGGAVLSAPLSGVVDGGAPVTLFAGSYPIIDLAIDSTSIYFAQSGCYETASDYVCSEAISSLPLAALAAGDAGAPTFLAGDHAAEGLAVGPADVYWTTSSKCQPDAGCNDNVESVPLGGGTPVTLASHLSLGGAIAVDDARLYAAGFSSLLGVPLDGGAITTLASNVQPAALAQNAATVYWTDLNAGQVTKLAKP
jgi:hypothetical protein